MDYLFTTERLGFRLWNEGDLVRFKQINASPKVMQYFPTTMTAKATHDFYNRIVRHFEWHGYGLFAVDVLKLQEFIGYIGFTHVRFNAFFTPSIEIGWRLWDQHWNLGYATEGAKACLDYGFQSLKLKEIVSFTAVTNKPSERVMQKIEMKKFGYFSHPLLEADSPLSRHVLYRIQRCDSF